MAHPQQVPGVAAGGLVSASASGNASVSGGASWSRVLQDVAARGDDVQVEVLQMARRHVDTFVRLDAGDVDVDADGEDGEDGEAARGPLAVEQLDGCRHFSVVLEPTDPDFKFDLPEGLRLEVRLPEVYPHEACEVRVLVESAAMPTTVARVVEMGVGKFLEAKRGRPMLRPMMRWLDRMLQALIEIGLEKQRLELETLQGRSPKKTPQSAPMRPVEGADEEPEPLALDEEPANPHIWTVAQQDALEKALAETQGMPTRERWIKIGKMVPGKKKKQCVARFKSLRDGLLMQQQRQMERESAGIMQPQPVEPAQPPPDAAPAAAPSGDGGIGRVELNPDHRGTQVQLQEVVFEGVSVFRAELVTVQVLCLRCGTSADLPLTPGTPTTDNCSQCHLLMGARFRGMLVHQHNSTLGYVDVQNCKAYDLLPADLITTCAECYNNSHVEQAVRATWYEINCRACHRGMRLSFQNVNFEEITGAASDLLPAGAGAAPSQPRRRSKKGHKSIPGLTVGEPLPKRGACKHYKHSYRWLRFPCCGKAFPCDTCHDEASDHKAAWAKRMICGSCSREQAYSKKGNCMCGQSFKPVAKRHWEGGAGCRSSTKMSRKEKKKFAGKFKTLSRKARRKRDMQRGKKKSKSTSG